jgi:hypothetical protein
MGMQVQIDTPPSSLMDSIASPKVKTTEWERVGAHSLVHNILKVKGHATTLRCGLRRLINNLCTHIDLHKLNNKWVNA